MGVKPAEWLLTNGAIWTGSDEVEALAIRGDRIVAVGSNEESEAAVGRDAVTIDLGGYRVVPGLIDSHLHFLRAGIHWDDVVRWDDLDSLEEGLARLRDRAAASPAGTWIRVLGGWHPHRFSEQRGPTKVELDAVAPGHPVYVQLLYEEAYLNTPAIALAVGETDPPGGSMSDAGSGLLRVVDNTGALDLWRFPASLGSPADAPDPHTLLIMPSARAAATTLILGLIAVGCSSASEPSTTSRTVTSTTVQSTTTVSTTTTVPTVGMEVGERIPGTALWGLVPGNVLDADRINLVFAPWGWDEFAQFEAVASNTLSWDGATYWVGESGDIVFDAADAVGAQLGVFGIEPWRSAQDRFNVWITDVEPETPTAWLNIGDPSFELSDQSVVTLALDAHLDNPDLTSVAGQRVHFVGPDPPSRPLVGSPFANLVVVIDSAYPADGLLHVPHELGHAMFNLPDEYVGQQLGFDGREDLSSWPSCAESDEEAEAWWGDLAGSVDPMVDLWITQMDEAGFPVFDPGTLEANVAVSNVDGGCYGVAGSIRATFDSLMNQNIPVLGSVNRRWAEEILDLWEGTPRS